MITWNEIRERVGPSFLLAICVICTTIVVLAALSYIPDAIRVWNENDEPVIIKIEPVVSVKEKVKEKEKEKEPQRCGACDCVCDCCEDCPNGGCKCETCQCCVICGKLGPPLRSPGGSVPPYIIPRNLNNPPPTPGEPQTEPVPAPAPN